MSVDRAGPPAPVPRGPNADGAPLGALSEAPSEGAAPPPLPAPGARPSVAWLLSRAAFLAIALLALWDTLRHAELDKVTALIRAVGAPIALVPAPFFVAFLLHAVALRRICTVLGREISLGRLFSVVLSGEGIQMTLPGGPAAADSMSPYLLKSRGGVPIPDGIAATAAKKTLIVLANALYMAVALGGGFGHLRRASPALIRAPGLEWMVLAAAIGLSLSGALMAKALLSSAIAARSFRLLRRIPSPRLARWLERQEAGFHETDQHFAVLFRERRGKLAAAVVLLLGMWLFEGLDTLVILRLLHVDLSFSQVISFEVVVVLLRASAFMIPGAIGIKDAGYVAFLSAFGVPDAATMGVAFLLIKRANELVWIIVGYAQFLLFRRASPRSRAARRA